MGFRRQTPGPEEDLEVYQLVRSVQGPMRRRRRIVLVVIALVLCGFIAYQTRADLRARYRRVRFHLLSLGDTSEVARVDLERLHAVALPNWIVANAGLQRARGPGAEDPQEAEAFKQLEEEVASNDTLLELVTEMRERTADPWRMPERADALEDVVARWNAYMDRVKRPWWIDSTLLLQYDRGAFILKTYRVHADVPVQVGARSLSARLVTRMDGTNVVETALGRTFTEQGGAVVLMNRVYDFALESVWPLLDPGQDAMRSPVDRAFAPVVRAEAQRGLSPATYAKLRDTAGHRFALVQTREAMLARQACGSTLSMRRLPWSGLRGEDVGRLQRYARGAADSGCPVVRPEEVTVLREASKELGATEGLEAAVEELAAWVARGVTVHEARHLADQVALGDGTAAPPCEPCGALEPEARTELSAYLASFADPASAATSMHQACGIVGAPTAHGLAMDFLFPRLGLSSCEAGPPPDLAPRARALETTLFGRSESITLPATFPTRVPLATP